MIVKHRPILLRREQAQGTDRDVPNTQGQMREGTEGLHVGAQLHSLRRISDSVFSLHVTET
jgi:hypothetical protein